MTPKISIIVPVYNSENYLKRCVESILNQTHQNIELILVDDGSTDKSPELCDVYAHNNKVKVEHIKNCGAGGARNVGLRIATGDYISFVDSDDWIHPDMLKTMLSIALEKKINLVECDLITVNNEEDINIDSKYSITIESRIDALKRILTNQRFSVVVKLYKRELLNGIFFREHIMSEDAYFSIEVLNKLTTQAIIPNTFYFYFSNTESVSKTPFSIKKLDTLDSALFIQNEILKKEKDQELIEITRKFVLEVLMYNYTELHYNPQLDSSLKHRKLIKQLIKENYAHKDASLRLKLARFLPIKMYSISIKLNALIKNNRQ